MSTSSLSGRGFLDASPGKVLIIKPSALGDVVHGLTFLHAFTERFPDAEVHWVVARGLDGILQGNPKISRLWIIDKDRWKRIGSAGETFRAIWKLGCDLREQRFDWVVDLQGLFRSGLIGGLTGCPVRVGFQEAREGSALFYTHRVRGGRDVHAIDRYLRIAVFLGCASSPVSHAFSPPVDTPLLATLPEEYVVLAPSAGGEAKKWPPERFGQLASRLPWTSVVVAGKSDAALASAVVQSSEGKAVSLAGLTSLRELIEVIRRARCLVSNDTGPMHIAAGLNVPVFALFGPTSPDRTGPYGGIHTIVRSDLPCSPCFRRRKCTDWRCMEGISVEQVLAAMEATGVVRASVQDRASDIRQD
ncbi:MAG: lipopolysaccharide heptosyltransferase II [Syntrophobacteraceae bacterium]